jgi:hypothetical protein
MTVGAREIVARASTASEHRERARVRPSTALEILEGFA